MPNPNTVAASMHTELDAAKSRYYDLSQSKLVREAALRTIRAVEEALDLPADERTPAHNGQPASLRAVQPLEELTLTLRELQDARNELKTLRLSDTGCIIHGLRRVLQHDTGDSAYIARHLLNRILRK